MRLSWQQASWDATSDPGGVGVRTLDGAPAELAYVPAGEVIVTPATTWRPRAHGAPLAGAQGFDIVQHRTRTVGTNVDCYVDEIVAVIYGKPL